MKKRRRKLFLATGVVFLLFGGFLVVTHYRAKWAVEAYRKQLIARGEKLSIAALIPPTPTNGANGAPALLGARLTTFDYDSQPIVMKMLRPSRARVSWMQAIEPSEKLTNIWPVARAQLQKNADELADIRAALAAPFLHFDLNYHQGFKLMVPHLANLKPISQRLSAATVMELHDGHPTAAFENLQACIALPCLFHDEPMMISQLVRIAIASIAFSATWEALQFPEWTDDQLAQLQSAWEAYRPREAMPEAFGMERAMGKMIFDEARLSYYKMDALWGIRTPNTNSVFGDLKEASDKLMTDPVEGLRNLYLRFPHYWAWKWWWSYDEELCSLQLWQASIEAARLISESNSFQSGLAHCEAQEQRLQRAYPKANYWFMFISELNQGIAKSYIKKVALAEIQREMIVTAIALKRFHRRQGKYPDQLAAIVPAYLRHLPVDWMDGKPLRYRLKENGEFVLYSVGQNGRDDGGDPGVSGRLLYFWQGHDAVWPVPASEAEIAADNAAIEKERRRYGLDASTNQPAVNTPR